jgi:GxxExxY protein
MPQSCIIAPNEITGAIVDASFKLYKGMGPGLLESVYETVLARDLPRRGLSIERQKWISFDYEGLWFDEAYCIDILVEHCVVVEIKSAIRLHPNHYKQVLTYMPLADCKYGLLLNFSAPTFKEAVKRLIL